MKNIDHKLMPSNRQLKAGELLKRTIVEVMSRGTLIEMPITVSEVRMSSDLKRATIFVIPFGGSFSREDFMKKLHNIAPMLRAVVTKKVQLKFSPELVFQFDESFDNVAKIDSLLEKLCQ